MSLECIQFGRQNWSRILMTVWLLSLFDITRRTDIIEYSWNEFWTNSVSLASSGYYHWYSWNYYGLSSTTYKPIFTSLYSFEFRQTFRMLSLTTSVLRPFTVKSSDSYLHSRQSNRSRIIKIIICADIVLHLFVKLNCLT